MKIESTRFGALDVDDSRIIVFPKGIIGFPEETGFVLVHHGQSDAVGWLQSVRTPDFALPVIGAQRFAPAYPDVSLVEAAHRGGLDGSPEDMTALVVLCAAAGVPPTVNLAAPIIVDSSRWTGVQTILEGTTFSTREMLSKFDGKEAPAAPAP